MSINVLSTGYYLAGYTNNKTTKTETGSSFADIANQKSTEAEGEIGQEKTPAVLDLVGKHSHMTQMGVQIGLKWAKGELDQADLLGDSVGSAISAVEKWIYDLDYPLPGQPARSIEQQRLDGIERAFYEAFIEKLRQLS